MTNPIHMPCYMATACVRTPSETWVAISDLGPKVAEAVTCPDCLARMVQALLLPRTAPLVRTVPHVPPQHGWRTP